jgi:hypothetical protein
MDYWIIEVIWNALEWYFKTLSEIKIFLAKHDNSGKLKMKMGEVKLIETDGTVELWHFDTDAELGQLVFKESRTE